MLPVKEFDGYWFFGNILTYFASNVIGIAAVWYLCQIILTVSAFFLSYKVFKSGTFSYMLVVCLGFGTHFYNAFQYSSIASLYLLQTLFLLLLYLTYEYIRREDHNKGYLYALVPTLILTAVFYEGWLDFFSAVFAISIFLFIYFKVRKQDQYNKRLLKVFLVFCITAGIYIYLKFTYIGFMHSTGESAVVFLYGTEYFWRAIEDMISQLPDPAIHDLNQFSTARVHHIQRPIPVQRRPAGTQKPGPESLCIFVEIRRRHFWDIIFCLLRESGQEDLQRKNHFPIPTTGNIHDHDCGEQPHAYHHPIPADEIHAGARVLRPPGYSGDVIVYCLWVLPFGWKAQGQETIPCCFHRHNPDDPIRQYQTPQLPVEHDKDGRDRQTGAFPQPILQHHS